MKLTTSLKATDVQRQWLEIDASGVPVGRLATLIAEKLSGRGQTKFTPHIDSGDFIVVINAENLVLTGNKLKSKKYYRHSGYPGGIKEASAGEQMEKDPTVVIKKAVYGMLPKNKLRDGMMKRLKVYTGSDHNHAAQKPTKLEVKDR